MAKRFFVLLTLFFGVLTVFVLPTSFIHAEDLLSVSQWENKYSTSSTDSAGMRLARTGDNGDIYPLGLYLDGATAMWRATGKTVYLDEALMFVNTVIGTAIPSSQIATTSWKTGTTSEYLSWPGFGGIDRKPEQNYYPYAKDNEYPLHESYMWRYVTALLRAMRVTPSVYGDPGYRAQYDQILAFTEKNVWEKWYMRGVNSYLYRSNAHMASHWAFIAMNLYAITSDPIKRAQYKTVWENIDHTGMPNYSGMSLRKHLIDHPTVPGGVFWTSFWNDYRLVSSSDTSHASAVVSYTMASMEYGNTDWNPTDTSKFIKTYEFVWPSADVYKGYLNGEGTYPGNANDGWIKLGRYDPQLQQRIQDITVARGAQLYGNGALNAKYLLEEATLDAPYNVVVGNVSTSTVTVTWSASSGSDISAYEIYRNNSLAGVTASSITSFQDIDVLQGVKYTYRVRARNTNGYVSVLAGPAIATTLRTPTATLTTSSSSIIAGQSATLTWSSQYATSCMGTGFATGTATSGSVSVTPTQTTTYMLSCTGEGGATSASTTVTVTAVQRVTIFSDSFESSLNWIKTGAPIWYTGMPKNGTHSVQLRASDSITKKVSLSGYKNVTVSFSMGAYSLGYTEDFQALYFNGTSWVVIADINQGTANENNKLNPYTITLPASANNLSSFQIRFKLNADSIDDYGFVDDVKITAIPF